MSLIQEQFFDIGANLTHKSFKSDIDKVIIDKNASSGVVPYLPLPELKKKDPK